MRRRAFLAWGWAPFMGRTAAQTCTGAPGSTGYLGPGYPTRRENPA